MQEKVLKNLQINLILTIIIGILGFVSNRYFSLYLGIEKLGLMRLFSQLISYLSLVDLGIGSAATYALYKPLAEKNYSRLNIVISTINSFYKKIAILIFFLGISMNFIIPFFLKQEGIGLKIYLYWSLYVVNTSISYIFAKYSIVFTANQEYGYVRKISGVVGIFSQLLQIITLIYFQSFFIFILINIFNSICCFIFYKYHYKKYYTYIEIIKERDKNIIRDVKNMFCHKIAGLVVSNTDYIVLAKFTTLALIAQYSSYLTVYGTIVMLVGIITSVIIPNVGRFIATHDKNDSYFYWRELYALYMFLGTIIIICTYKLIFYFIYLWLGKDYILPKLTEILILINLFISITRSVTDIFKDGYGFFEDIYTPIFESLINLIISLLLVQKIGLNGVIIGTIASNIIIVYIFKPILVFKRCFDKTAFDYFKILCQYLLLIVVTIIISEYVFKILKLKLDIKKWLDFIKYSFVIGGITSICGIFIFMLDFSFRNFIRKIIK